MRSFKELYDELDIIDYDQYSSITEEELLQIFTEEEITDYIKDGSIVLELDEGVFSSLKKGVQKVKSAVKSAAGKAKSAVKKFRVVSKAARKKIALRMKRLMGTASHQKKIEKSKKKIASPAKMKVKAAKMAKEFVINKYYPKYKDMGVAQRVKIDQQIQAKYGGMIAKLSVKWIKKVRSKEIEKVKKAREIKQDA